MPKPTVADAIGPMSNKHRLLRANHTVARSVDFSQRVVQTQKAQSHHFLSGPYAVALTNILTPNK